MTSIFDDSKQMAEGSSGSGSSRTKTDSGTSRSVAPPPRSEPKESVDPRENSPYITVDGMEFPIAFVLQGGGQMYLKLLHHYGIINKSMNPDQQLAAFLPFHNNVREALIQLGKEVANDPHRYKNFQAYLDKLALQLRTFFDEEKSRRTLHDFLSAISTDYLNASPDIKAHLRQHVYQQFYTKKIFDGPEPDSKVNESVARTLVPEIASSIAHRVRVLRVR